MKTRPGRRLNRTQCDFIRLEEGPHAGRFWCRRPGCDPHQADTETRNCRRNCRSGLPVPPPLPERLRNYTAAVGRWRAVGRPARTDAEVQFLLRDICRHCQAYDQEKKRCAYCGCRTDEGPSGWFNKLRMATEACPLGKWRGAGETLSPRHENPKIYLPTTRLVADTYRLARALPPVGDVIGIARSGILPAAILADQFHARLWTYDGRQCTATGHGWRLSEGPDRDALPVLLVDDTAASGRSLREAAPIVEAHFRGRPLAIAAVYSMPAAYQELDYAACLLGAPHYLEWNFWQSVMIHGAALDFDGILCRDIEPGDDDDGARYLRAIREAVPWKLPRRHHIPLIVTARRAVWEEPTRQWLARHGVRVRRLVMYPGTFRERNRPGEVIRYKAEHYGQSGLEMYVESEPGQAREIARQTGKPVLCPAAGLVY
jgi:hypothetical protein